jgi:hypothetical protein
MNNAPTTDQSRQGVTSNQHKHNITKPSLRSAINAMCHHCLYDRFSGLGSWRQQIEACTAKTCPLYNVRPKSTGYIRETENALENSELAQNGLVSDTAKVVP